MIRTYSLVPRTPPAVPIRQRIAAAWRTLVGPFNLKDPWPKDPALRRLFGDGYESAAGITVTRENAFTFSAVFDAVNQLSSDPAKLPLNLHKRRKDGGSDHYVDSHLYYLLKYEPNPEMSSMVFRRTLLAHALTCHGGYAEIERDNADRPLALWILTPDRVEPIRRKLPTGKLGPLEFRIDNNDNTILPARDVLHIHGLGYDGHVGYSVIDKARQAIALALAAERFGAQYFGKGTIFGGWLETEEDLDDEQKADIRENIEKFRAAQDSAWRILVTGIGHKFHQFASKASDAQLDESRVRQVEEVARFFRMPPHRLGVNTPGTVSYASVEAADLDYYKGPLLDWGTLIEQEFNRKLIPRLERRQQFIKHNFNAFLRGTIKERYDALGVARDKGIINADEWRELEDMNPQDGGQGKLYLVQSAQVPLNKIEAVADATIEASKAKAKKAQTPPAAPAPASDQSDADRETIALLEQRIAAAEGVIATAEQQGTDLQTQLAVAQADATVRVETIEALRASELKQQEIAASTLVLVAGLRTELEAALVARAEAVTALEVAQAEAESDRQQASDREAEVISERDRLSADAEQLRAAAAAAETQAAAVASDRDATAEARAEAQRQAEQARAEADAAEQARTAAEALVTEAQQDRADADQRVADLEAQAARDAAARADAERLAQEARTAQEQAVAQLAADLSAATAREQQARIEADSLGQTCTDLRQQLEAVAATQLASESDVTALRASLAALEQERDAARTVASTLEQEREQARAAAAAADEQLRTAGDAAQRAQEEVRARRLATVAAHRGLVVDAMGRMVRREVEQARRRQATQEKFRRWLDGFPTLHEAICVEALLPAIRVHVAWRAGASDPTVLTTTLVREHLALFDRHMRAVLESDPGEFHAELDRALTRWESERPAAVADALLLEEVRDVVA